jgi:hypothetical protein
LETYKDYGSQNSQVGSERHLKNCPLQKQKVAAKSQGTVKLHSTLLLICSMSCPFIVQKTQLKQLFLKLE